MVPTIIATRSAPWRAITRLTAGMISSSPAIASRAVRLSHADSEGGSAGSGSGTAPVGVSNGNSSGQGPRPERPARRPATTSLVVVPRAFMAA